MRPTFEAITFDAAGTLIRLREPVGTTYSQVARRHGVMASPRDLEEAFRAAWKTALPPFASPDDNATEKDWWRSLVREVFRISLAELPSPDLFDEMFEDLFSHFARPGVWEAVPGSRSLLEELRSRRIPLAIISNFDDRLRAILSDLNMIEAFRWIILSAEVRSAKPNRAIFDEAIRRIGLPPDRILHVGDDPVRDGEGARSAGMACHLVGKNGGTLGDIVEKFRLRRTHY